MEARGSDKARGYCSLPRFIAGPCGGRPRFVRRLATTRLAAAHPFRSFRFHDLTGCPVGRTMVLSLKKEVVQSKNEYL